MKLGLNLSQRRMGTAIAVPNLLATQDMSGYVGEASVASAGVVTNPDGGTSGVQRLTPGVAGNAPGVTSGTANRKFSEVGELYNGNWYNRIWVKTDVQDSQVGLYVVNLQTDDVKASRVIVSSGAWQLLDVSGATTGAAGFMGLRWVVASQYAVLLWNPYCQRVVPAA